MVEGVVDSGLPLGGDVVRSREANGHPEARVTILEGVGRVVARACLVCGQAALHLVGIDEVGRGDHGRPSPDRVIEHRADGGIEGLDRL